MRKLMIASILTLVTSLTFGQKRLEHDPSYSIHNYKHPNKAAYAKEHNLDKSENLKAVNVLESSDYKHPMNRRMEKKYSITTQAKTKQRGSYKHPYGL
jgi:hypothetical protein